MSAFLCSRDHISAIVNARYKFTSDRRDRASREDERIFTVLVDANIDSVETRYPDVSLDVDHFYSEFPNATSVVEAIKLIQSYRHQSCESLGWEDSEADKYTTELIFKLISYLPDWDIANWAI